MIKRENEFDEHLDINKKFNFKNYLENYFKKLDSDRELGKNI